MRGNHGIQMSSQSWSRQASTLACCIPVHWERQWRGAVGPLPVPLLLASPRLLLLLLQLSDGLHESVSIALLGSHP